MGKFMDLSGMKFNKLNVIKMYGKNKYGHILWLCKCDCGSEKEKIATSVGLKNGTIKSCGCLNKENILKLKILNTKHLFCKIDNCNNKHDSLGYCNKHYSEYKKHGKILTEEERKKNHKRPSVSLKNKLNQICEICGKTTQISKYKKFNICVCEKHRAQLRVYGKILNETRFDPNEIIIYENYAEIILKNIYLKEVGRAIIDLEKIDLIKNMKWHIDDKGYAETTLKNKCLKLHKYIMNIYNNVKVDHKNRNRLDCRLENLRFCTHKENNYNKAKREDGKSQIRGVYCDKYNKWVAYIGFNYKKIHLGYFKDKESAIQARKEGEIKYFGEFAPHLFDEKEGSEND